MIEATAEIDEGSTKRSVNAARVRRRSAREESVSIVLIAETLFPGGWEVLTSGEDYTRS